MESVSGNLIVGNMQRNSLPVIGDIPDIVFERGDIGMGRHVSPQRIAHLLLPGLLYFL